MRASPIVAQDTGPHALYWRFHDAVARAQLTSWLAPGSQRPHRHLRPRLAGARARRRGRAQGAARHRPERLDRGGRHRPGRRPLPATRPALRLSPGPAPPGTPSSPPMAAALQFLADGCADGVIAEDRTLSRRLAAETLVERDPPGAAPRRPGAGLGRLADPGHGGAGRAAPLAAPGRLAACRRGAHPLAGRHHHPLLRHRAVARAVHLGRLRGQLDPLAHGACPPRLSATSSDATRPASGGWWS